MFIKLSGMSMARGRNDWFTLREIQAQRLDKAIINRFSISGYSNRIGNAAPLELKLSMEDALVLAHTLTRMIDDAVVADRQEEIAKDKKEEQ